MVTQSNFERDRVRHEEHRQLVAEKKRKQADYYHAISKITYTALVVGVIVTMLQNPDKINYLHFATLAIGGIVTVTAFIKGNNKLK